MISKEEINSIVAEHGFNDFHWIDPHEIIVAEWVRVKCTFGCRDYGQGTCPPHTPGVDQCRTFFKEYKHALIFKLNVLADKNKYPSDWSKSMTKHLLDIEKEVFLKGYQKAFLLNQTCCSLCKECSRSRVNCIDKSNSRPGPEAFAVDVYQTLKNIGIDIHVITSSPSNINRVAILLIE